MIEREQSDSLLEVWSESDGSCWIWELIQLSLTKTLSAVTPLAGLIFLTVIVTVTLLPDDGVKVGDTVLYARIVGTRNQERR